MIVQRGYYQGGESGSPWMRAVARARERTPIGFGVRDIVAGRWLEWQQLRRVRTPHETSRAILPDAYTAKVWLTMSGLDTARYFVQAIFD